MRRIKIDGMDLDQYLIKNEIKIQELQDCILTDDGYEVNNPIPLVLDTGLKRPPTLAEQIKRVLRTEIDLQAMESGKETFDQANDFDIDDDDMPESKYDVMDDEYPIEKEPLAAEAVPAEPQPKAAEAVSAEKQTVVEGSEVKNEG